MRFFEIASPRLRIVASKRFMKNAAVYLRGGYPGLDKTLKEFLDFKSMHPTELFGAKDAPMKFQLRAYWHVHLVHGKVVVIYRTTSTKLLLYDMVEHTAFDNANQTAKLGDQLDSMATADFVPLATDDNAAPSLTSQEKKDLDDLLYEMSVQDRDILSSALSGDFADLMEFMTLVVEKDPSVIIRGFGGGDALKHHIRQVMKQMGIA